MRANHPSRIAWTSEYRQRGTAKSRCLTKLAAVSGKWLLGVGQYGVVFFGMGFP